MLNLRQSWLYQPLQWLAQGTPPGKLPGIPPGMSPALWKSLVKYRGADFFQLFLLMFKFFLLCSLVIKPVDFIALVKNLLFGLIIDLALKFFIFNSWFMLKA